MFHLCWWPACHSACSMSQVDKNSTQVSEFFIVGFPSLQHEYFHIVAWFFLIFYVTTVVGNLVLVVVFALEHNLQKPMYITMVSLALSDIGKCFTKIYLFHFYKGHCVFCLKMFVNSCFRFYHGCFTETHCSLLVEWWEYWLSHMPVSAAHGPLLWQFKLSDHADHGCWPIPGDLFSSQVDEQHLELIYLRSMLQSNNFVVFLSHFSPQISHADDHPNHDGSDSLLLGHGTHLSWHWHH